MTSTKLNQKNSYKEFLSRRRDQEALAEMAYKQGTTQPYKLSEPANWIISFMPDDYSQKHALSWMMNKGLYEAATKRHLLAEEASKILGRQVYDHEIFSPAAHKADPRLGELWETKLKKQWEAYEPKKMRFNTRDGEREIDLTALNKFIEGQGLPQFSFGGPDGLIEWLEDGAGKWAQKLSSGSPISGGEHHDRTGLDLSNPEWLRDEVSGKRFYRFGSNSDISTRFHPPHDMSSLDEALNNMRRISGAEIEQAIANGDKSTLPPKTLAWIANRKDKLNKIDAGQALATRVKGAAGKGVKEVKVADDEWDKVVAALDKGIRKFNDEKASRMLQARAGGKNSEADQGFMDEVSQKWSEAEIQEILNGLLDPENKIVKEKYDDPLWKRVVTARANAVGKKPGDPGFNHRNYRHAKVFMDLGMEGLPQDQIPMKTVSKINYTFPDVTPHDYVNQTEYENVPIDLKKDILDQGYEMPEDKSLEKDSTIVFRKGAGDYIIADKDQQGNWSIRNVVGSKPFPPGKKWQGAPLVVSGSEFSSHSNLAAPMDAEKSAAFQKNWYDRPQEFGDETTEIDGIRGLPKSLADATKAAKSMDWQTFKNVKPSELIGAGQEAMSQLYGSWAFKYGDPRGIWTKRASTKDKYSIYSLFADQGISKEEGDKYIDELYKATGENRKPNFPPNIEAIFLQNGYNWRVGKAASMMSKYLGNERKVAWKEKSGITSKGKEGDEQSIMGNIGDRNSGQIQTSDYRDVPQVRGGKISKLRGDSHQIQSVPNISAAQAASANNAATATKSIFKNTTLKTFPAYEKDTGYNQRYNLVAGKLQKLGIPSDANDPLGAAYKFATSVAEILEDNTSSAFGTAQTPSQVRGVLDATGDFLAQKMVDIANTPDQSESEMATASAVISRFFNGPQGLQAIATKLNAGDYRTQPQMLGRYLSNVNSSFVDDISNNWMALTKQHADSQKQPATPAPAVGQQPAPQQMAYYYDPDDEEAVQPPLQMPKTGVAQQQQTAVTSRNPLAAIRKPMPPTQAEMVYGMPTFKEWNNWKTLRALKNGSKT